MATRRRQAEGAGRGPAQAQCGAVKPPGAGRRAGEPRWRRALRELLPWRPAGGPPQTGRSGRPRASGGRERWVPPPPPPRGGAPARPQRPPSPPQAPPDDAPGLGAPPGPGPRPLRRRHRAAQSRPQAARPRRQPGAPRGRPELRRQRPLAGPQTSPAAPPAGPAGGTGQEAGAGAGPGGQAGLGVPPGAPQSGPRGAGARLPAGGRGARRRLLLLLLLLLALRAARRGRAAPRQPGPLQIRQHRGPERRGRGGGAEPPGAAGRRAPARHRRAGPQEELVPAQGQRRPRAGRQARRPAALRAPRGLPPDSCPRPPLRPRPRRPRARQPPAGQGPGARQARGEGGSYAPRAAAGLRPRRAQESGQHVLHERGAAVPEQHQAAARLLPAQGLPAGAARRAPRPPGAHRGLRRCHRGAVAPRVHRGRQPRALQGRLSEIRPLLHRLQPAGRAGVPQVLHGPAARRDQPQGPQDAQHPCGHAPRPRARGRRHAERRRARQPDVEAVPGEGGQQDRGPLRGAAEELPQVPGVRLPLHHLRGLLRPLPAHPQEELRGREGFAPRLLQPLHQGGGAGLGERARVRQVPAADAQHQEAHDPALPPRPGAAPQPLLHHALLHQEVLRLRRLPPAAAQPARVRQREGGQPRLQPVRALQPLGQRALRPLHRLLPRPLGLAALQRLPREPGAVQRGLRPLLRAPRPPRQEALSRPPPRCPPTPGPGPGPGPGPPPPGLEGAAGGRAGGCT
ncbi:ubiquitin carboxyl-terminal hydrolase 21 isoform X2 [Cygnus olor]|uniref:ubiquitin carboxyl-terminal hydrolase 21 isoform X2 n=1 Tax=Cygnus olor TaxID=8869 RepID=UPI001ADE034A|nr:ubiquitin carboxyl-terminal hydrolase 21 isoform X2 [Cygnus olor]